MPKQTSQKRELLANALKKVFLGVFAIILFGGFWFTLRPQTATAATSSYLNFQARLQTAAGAIVPDGNYFIEFNLYTASSGGASIWTERYQGSSYACPFGSATGATNTKVAVANGYVSVNLGSLCSFPSSINWDQQLWLTMNVGGSGAVASWDGEMNPRLQLTAIPYAFKAGQLAQFNSATGFTSTLNLLQPTVGNQVFQIPDQGAGGTFNILTAPSGSDGYVKLQATSGSPQTGYLNISGAATAGSLQAASLDTASAGTLTIGGNANTTSISIAQNTTIAAGKSITISGGNTASRPSSPTEGMLYYDTTTKALLVYANGKWQANRSTANKIVGTSASGGTSSAVASQNPDAADYVNTSTTSAQTTINSAISALPATGGIVYLMDGTYVVDGSITIPSGMTNVTLVGSGANTILKIKNSQNAATDVITSAASTIDHVTISNLKIDGNSSNQTSGTMNGITFNTLGGASTLGGQLSNLWFENIRNGGTAFNFTNLYNTNISNVVANSLGTIINVTTAGNGNTISNISLTSSGVSTNGISLGSTVNYTAISNVSLSGNGGTGITIAGNNNTVTGIQARSISPVVNVSGSYNSVTGGSIVNGGGQVWIRGSHNTVSGLSVASTVSEPINISSGTDNTISNNNFDSSDTGSCATGSIIISDSSRNLITGNTITNSNANGIYITRVSGTVDANIISNNTIYNSGTSASCGSTDSGITINGGVAVSNTRITNNTITDTAGTGYAINITGSVATGTYLSGNAYSGTGASSINDAGNNTIYVNQADSNGNLINKTQGGGFTIGTGTASGTFSIQGGVVATQLPAPVAGAVGTTGSPGSTTYRYQITALDGSGETVGSNVVQTTTGNATLSTSNFNTVNWSAVPGAYKYNIYRCTTTACTPLLLATVAGNITTYLDQAAGSPSGAAPSTNTTGGGTFAGALQAASGLTIGTASAKQGSITFNNSSNANTVSIVSGTTSASYSIQLPSAIGSTGQCLSIAGVASTTETLGYTSCGGGNPILNQLTQQTSANFNIDGTGTIGTSLTTPLIQSSGSTLTLQATTTLSLDTSTSGTLSLGNGNAATINIATNNATHVVSIANGTTGNQTIIIGSTVGVGSTTLQGGSGGLVLQTNSSSASIIARTNTNSTTGFQIQNASNAALFNLDTTTGNITLGTGGDTVVFSSSGGLVANGNAQHTKSITLPAEYAGAVLDSQYDTAGPVNCFTNNNGTMTSGFDFSNTMNYYKWTSNATAQCYDVVVRIPIPSDWTAWSSTTPLTVNAYTTSTSTGLINAEVRNSSGTVETNCNYVNITPSSTGTWSNANSSNCVFASTTTGYSAGSMMTLRLRMTGNTSSDVRIAGITLSYKSSF